MIYYIYYIIKNLTGKQYNKCFSKYKLSCLGRLITDPCFFTLRHRGVFGEFRGQDKKCSFIGFMLAFMIKI